jgi:thiol peroxidase
MERKTAFQGNPLTLVGRNLKINNPAPNFRAVSTDLKELTLHDFNGKIKLITSFPSADTPVCDMQLKEFNKRAVSLSPDIIVIGISKDLPFAQKRFCDLNGIKNVTTLSDYRYSSFGINYGLLIKELNLLARSVLILDKDNVLRYNQLVDDLTHYPDYEDALGALGNVLKNPRIEITKEVKEGCQPCETGVGILTNEEAEKLIANYRRWQIIDGKKITKEFKFNDFLEAKYFLDLISVIAQEQGHHPIFTLNYNKLKITLTTYAVSGLSKNDFIMAKIIDELSL